jgi:type VI secretion system secreted protein Hcp
MKRAIWIGAAIAVALVAAPVLWLALDDGGSRTSGALVEPTAAGGDVAKLTLTGANSGVVQIPVRSFSWGLSVPVSAGQASGAARRVPLEIIKPIDAATPTLFSMLVTNEAIQTAKLDLLNASGLPYLSYTFANASLANWDDTTSEKLTLYYQSFTTSMPKAARPTAPASQVIGQMTVSGIGPTPVPIVGFAAGALSPRDPASGLATGKRQHKPVTVSRAVDGYGPSVLQKVSTNGALGNVTIELQRPDEAGVMKTYATYVYGNAFGSAVEDSAAAGAGPATQKLEFVFQNVNVTVGAQTATDSLTTAPA